MKLGHDVILVSESNSFVHMNFGLQITCVYIILNYPQLPPATRAPILTYGSKQGTILIFSFFHRMSSRRVDDNDDDYWRADLTNKSN